MAKTASTKSGGKGKKKPAPAARKKTAQKSKAKASASGAASQRSARAKPKPNAADALIGLVESPIVADLLAAAVTAAAATMLEHRLKRNRETGSLVRAVGAAAAAAVGRQLASEIEEIRKAAEESRGGKEA